ncbi:MAG: DUF5668 domain-containing protein [candidate division WOR-3 bacterium]
MKSAFILIFIGLLIWFLNLGYLSFFKWSRDWPLIIVFVGIYMIISSLGKRNRIKKSKRRKVLEILERLEKGEINVDEAKKEIEDL